MKRRMQSGGDQESVVKQLRNLIRRPQGLALVGLVAFAFGCMAIEITSTDRDTVLITAGVSLGALTGVLFLLLPGAVEGIFILVAFLRRRMRRRTPS